ncbi:MAG: GntR family transcriptional regulator [Pseudomonadota bacterium]|nr:GntR family transcriptional regulator [Pseudomonadota bacterium]
MIDIHTSGETLGNASLQDRIRQALESDFQQGLLTPGMAINERELGERFGASRTPVREALLLLAAKGLVEILPRAGIYVRQLEARELVAMMEGLSELEGVLARLASTRINARLRERLGETLAHTARCADSHDAAAYAQANAELHNLIYEASGNAYIVEETRQLRLRISPYRGQLFEKPGRLAQSQREHERVVQAICAGDTEAAAETMRQHISAGGRAFADMVLGTPAPVYARGQRRASGQTS